MPFRRERQRRSANAKMPKPVQRWTQKFGANVQPRRNRRGK